MGEGENLFCGIAPATDEILRLDVWDRARETNGVHLTLVGVEIPLYHKNRKPFWMAF